MNDDELRGLFESMRGEFTAEFALMRQEFAYVHQRIDSLTVKTESGFEQVNHKIDLLGDATVLLNEKLDREAADIRAEMRQGFADTHALIRFGHSDLDRRIRTLEAK